MTFQFLCPQGHLLQGEEAHMGMECQCPQCGMAFIIPTIQGAGQSPAAEVISPAEGPQIELEPLSLVDQFAEPADGEAPASEEPTASLDLAEIAATQLGSAVSDEPMLHIPCPNGHELETPLDMIGQRAQCPHCGVEFRLRREKSIEYLFQQELIDRRRAKFWFQLAVMAASFVGFVLVVMIGIMLFS
jgi:hypothetical protein